MTNDDFTQKPFATPRTAAEAWVTPTMPRDIPDDDAMQETDGVKSRIHGLMYGNPPPTLRDWASYRATQLLNRLDVAVSDAAVSFTDFVIRLVRKLEG